MSFRQFKGSAKGGSGHSRVHTVVADRLWIYNLSIGLFC